jgi:hypothetical protein
MKTFKLFLDTKNLTPNAFSVQNKCSNATTWRAYNGKPLRPHNAKKFHQLTGKKVPVLSFLFPDAS